MRTFPKLLIVTLVAAMVTIGGVIATTIDITASSKLAFTDEMLPEAELKDLATRVAETMGMTNIREIEYTLMTRGSLLTMLGGGDGGLNPREAPMFVAQFKGDIEELRMYGHFSPEEKFDTIILSLDARSGALYHNSAHHSALHSVDIMASYIDMGEPIDIATSIPTLAPSEPDEAEAGEEILTDSFGDSDTTIAVPTLVPFGSGG